MPSFTFVSTANAFVLRGAVPVFVDIRAGHAQHRRALIEAAITPRTRAICVVHYAGVGCEMDAILAHRARSTASRVVEDAAQGILLDLPRARRSAAIGAARRAQLPRDQERHLPARAARCSSTTRASPSAPRSSARRAPTAAQFFRGQVDKYTWVDVGSSYLPGEIIAAFLAAQLEEAEAITRRRMAIWGRYHLGRAARAARLGRRPIVPAHCVHNAHMYYLLLPTSNGAPPSSRAEIRRRRRGLPLRPAALVAGRPAFRPRRRLADHRRRR